LCGLVTIACRKRVVLLAENRPLIDEFRADLDCCWERLVRLCGEM
jgi:hypothetical protein